MSSKKDKLIEEAQRLILRGQLDKAIKAYEQILSIDASALNLRQKFADLLVKAGRFEDARVEYEKVGKQYSSNGFYLKAIAVYKQVQKLFPNDITITLVLAGLNEKHGLVGNALAEYKQVYDYYEKASDMEEALKILDKMQAVDPQNVNIKFKLAESYYHVGKNDESYAAFGRLAALLQERGDTTAFSRLNARIQQLFPDKSEFMLEVLAEQVESGNAANAITGIQSLLRSNPNDKRIWELIVSAYRKLDQTQRVKMAYQHYLKFFPDELAAKQGLIECLVAEKDVKGALSLLELYEQDLLDGGAAAGLVQIYKRLADMDPINVGLLEGLKRSCEASGDVENAEELDHKLASLNVLSTNKGREPSQKTEPDSAADLDNVEGAGAVSPEFTEKPVDYDIETPATLEYEETTLELDDVSVFTQLEAIADEDLQAEDDIEIEIEIDEDLGFDDVDAEEAIGASGDNWLDSVGAIFDSIADSPRGVKFGSDLDTSDAQSHYDLGLAFKEMGLFDEAINEFRQAAADPARKVECLILQGACLREKGDPDSAEVFLRSLLQPGLGLQDTCAVKYELVLTSELLGRNEDAASLLAEIDVVNPGFRDVRSRLDAAGIDNTLDFSEEDLKGFDLK